MLREGWATRRVQPRGSPKKKEPKKQEVVKEKVDIIDINSQTRPLAISVNNTPVAVKVQTGFNMPHSCLLKH